MSANASAAGAECRAPLNCGNASARPINTASIIRDRIFCNARRSNGNCALADNGRTVIPFIGGGIKAPVRATQQPEANLMRKQVQTASLFAAIVAAMLMPATLAEAGGSHSKKAKTSGANSSQMMRLGGPRSNNGRASSARTFDSANTGYGEYGSVGFANGEQRFDGVSIRQRFLKQSQEGKN
jgi:hypothetical protein